MIHFPILGILMICISEFWFIWCLLCFEGSQFRLHSLISVFNYNAKIVINKIKFFVLLNDPFVERFFLIFPLKCRYQLKKCRYFNGPNSNRLYHLIRENVAGLSTFDFSYVIKNVMNFLLLFSSFPSRYYDWLRIISSI